MALKYDPWRLFFSTVTPLEMAGKMAVAISSSSQVLKEYEIFIEIIDTDDQFKINVDDEFNYVLSRGSEGYWRPQNHNELDKNEDQLGRVTVKKEGTIKRDYENFNQFFDDIMRG